MSPATEITQTHKEIFRSMSNRLTQLARESQTNPDGNCWKDDVYHVIRVLAHEYDIIRELAALPPLAEPTPQMDEVSYIIHRAERLVEGESWVGPRMESEQPMVVYDNWRRMRRWLEPMIIERDGAICRLCGDFFGPFSIDHVQPISKGGQNSLANFQILCRPCNIKKGAKWPQ